SEHPLVQDGELVKLFEDLYQKMPDCSRNLWNYNNPIMARLQADIDNISTNYFEKYHSDEFKELRERINTQEEVYKQAYGDSKKDYGKNKMKDL
ncbi:relaxase MobL, partial [Eubacterium ventriosum]|uniref:relaxase MobL n=1 Tax=Eubacterium ventriosum TaxID=39496 RepID=UPI00210DA162